MGNWQQLLAYRCFQGCDFQLPTPPVNHSIFRWFIGCSRHGKHGKMLFGSRGPCIHCEWEFCKDFVGFGIVQHLSHGRENNAQIVIHTITWAVCVCVCCSSHPTAEIMHTAIQIGFTLLSWGKNSICNRINYLSKLLPWLYHSHWWAISGMLYGAASPPVLLGIPIDLAFQLLLEWNTWTSQLPMYLLAEIEVVHSSYTMSKGLQSSSPLSITRLFRICLSAKFGRRHIPV